MDIEDWRLKIDEIDRQLVARRPRLRKAGARKQVAQLRQAQRARVRRVAQLLGFERSGIARIRVRVLKDESQEAKALAQRGIVGGGGVPISAASSPTIVAEATASARP